MHLKVGDENSHLYDVIDIDTGMAIPYVQEANDETGEFTIFLKDEDDLIMSNSDIDEFFMPILFKFKGNIKLVKK